MCLHTNAAANKVEGPDRQVSSGTDEPMQFLIEMHQEPYRVLIIDPNGGDIVTELDEASSRALLSDTDPAAPDTAAGQLAAAVHDFLQPPTTVSAPPAGAVSKVLEDQFKATKPDTTRKTRRKLWELAHKLHCPVIGTCLDANELRRIAQKAGASASSGLSDYDVHVSFVSAADEKNSLSHAAQKALEKKFTRQIRHFAHAKTREQLITLWEESLARGDVPGGLWATLTHPRCDDALRVRAFEEIHMLSHQIGAGQRADLKRLAEAEAELKAMQRDFYHIKRGKRRQLEAREQQISTLEGTLSKTEALLRAAQADVTSLRHEVAELKGCDTVRRVDELSGALDARERRLATLEREAHALQEALSSAERENADLQTENSDLLAECETMEQFVSQALRHGCDDCDEPASANQPDLGGRRILCVGGRARLIEQYRAMVKRCNGRFEHYDGGVEESRQRLDALLSSADAVVCATDSVSHDAYYRLKRFCKRAEKPHVFMRSSGMSSFTRAIYGVAGAA